MHEDPRVEKRAEELLPEEKAVGSDDHEAQAAQILAESDARLNTPRAVEHRTSEDTVEPPE